MSFVMFEKKNRHLNGYRSYSDQLDSGSESHPLYSSDVSSNASRDSFGPNYCMFRDSETSDYEGYAESELPRRTGAQQTTSASPSNYGATDRTQSSWPPPGPPAPLPRQTWPEVTFNRYEYYNKLGVLPTNLTKDPLLQQLLPNESILRRNHFQTQTEPTKKQNSLVTIFSVWNTIVGSSILVLPWGVERAGLIGAIVIILFIGLLCLYTTNRILQVHKRFGLNNPDGEVPELCLELLGRPFQIIAKMFSMLVLLGALVVYWILMTNFLYHSVYYFYDLIKHVSDNSLTNGTSYIPKAVCPRVEDVSRVHVSVRPSTWFTEWWHIENTAPFVLAIFIAPIVNFKSATFFTKFNSLGTISLIYLLVMVIVKAVSWGPHMDFSDKTSPHYTPLIQSSFPALSGTLALSFFIHNIVISLMRNNRHQEHNSRDLTIAYILVILTYMIIALGFYLYFPLLKSCIEDNFLNNFKSNDSLTVAARISLLFQLITVYPLIAFLVRVQIFRALTGENYPGLLYVITLNGLIITCCIFFAVFFPNVGTIVRYTGALSGFIYIFSLPILLHLASLRRRGKLTILNCILHLCIPVIGGINLISQFFVSSH